tara:strand:- start:2272 stop:2940 length:669 start_codon:yes stop_codon:yes gene_type:complete
MLDNSIWKNCCILGIFGLIAGILLSVTYEKTKDKIAESERKIAKKIYFEIIPVERHDNDILSDTTDIPEEYLSLLGVKKGKVNLVRKNNQLVAIIVPVTSSDGYSGDIKMLVGINVNGTIAATRVLSHKETLGLGDKLDISKSDWILGFNGKSLSNPKPELWKLKKDGGYFDQFTGATITPRAVVSQVLNALVYYEKDKLRLFEEFSAYNPVIAENILGDKN